MAETFRLDASGPHSADYTIHVAQALAECARVLNHASRTRQGLPYPSTIHDLLGHLSTAVARLDQLLPQLADQLARFTADSRITDANDAVGDPAPALATAQARLDVARHSADLLARQLASAHTATAGLYLRDGGQ